jgi:hypothetical protein
MLDDAKAALLDPDAFFASRIDDPNLRGPAAVVLTLGVLGLLSSIPIMLAMLNAMPGETQSFFLVGAAFGLGGALVGPFVIWLVYAGVFYAISMLFDASGDFRTTFTLVGWGFLPSILRAVLGAAAMFVLVQGATVPGDPQAMASFSAELQSRPLYQVVSLLGVLLTLWSGYVWTYAVKHARGLSVRNAAITVGVPVAVSVGWTLFSLL